MERSSVFIGPEEDRLALRELIDRYSDAVIRQDGAAWAETWAEDAVWCFRGSRVAGRDAILSTWLEAMAGFESVWFMAAPGSIIVTGDTAEMVTHTFEYLVASGFSPKLQSGLYRDQARRNAGGWCFASRDFTPRELSL